MSKRPLDQRVFILLIFSLVFPIVFSSAGELYKWIDDEGVVHMTDTLSQIPPQYRDKADKRTLQTAIQPDIKPESQKSTLGNNSAPAVLDLKHTEVAYQAFEGEARRIIISVTFNESVRARMLLDTGSPGLMISPDLARRLGLLDEQVGKLLVTAAGIGGSVPALLSVVDSVRVGDAHAEFLPATITKMPSKEFEGLVGMDFMANYRIGIDTDNNVIAFDEMPPQIDKPGGHDQMWWRSNFQRFARLKAEWGNYVEELQKGDLTSSEKDRRIHIAKNQYDEADKLYQKLEKYARDSAVPIEWRH